MFNPSHIRHFSSVFVSPRDFELIMQILRAGSPDVFMSMIPPIYTENFDQKHFLLSKFTYFRIFFD